MPNCSKTHEMQLTAQFRMLLCLAVVVSATANAQEPAPDPDPEYSRRGADSCLACHDDQETLGLFRTNHAVPSDARGPFGRDQLQCEACHGPGGEHAARVRRGQERPPILRAGYLQNDLCLGCHDAEVGSGWHQDAHAYDQVGCGGCHTIHTARDAVRETATQAEVCYDCHPLQRSEALRAFSHPFVDGKIACTSCHSPHESTVDSLLARQTLNDTCYQCHAEKRGPFLFEHQPVREDCSTCHDPHGSNQTMMLQTSAPRLCQSCHLFGHHQTVPGEPTQVWNQNRSCTNCHYRIHGSNHPSGVVFLR